MELLLVKGSSCRWRGGTYLLWDEESEIMDTIESKTNSRNCALLKEAVVNFLAENHCEAAANISFADFPGHVVKDLLIAFSRNRKKDGNGTNVDKLTTLSVSELRRKLDEKGLEVDGSREAMIESIKSNT
eukprot:scaffold11756_cov151-Skeletonema_menzelii.AAC.13